MLSSNSLQLICDSLVFKTLIRLLVAGFCGAFIGYERKSRLKMAGIRTHLIVALGSALAMIVSKYGFSDLIGVKNMSIDPSRIGSLVVSGIGFLGAGMIFMEKHTVKGLTTAAGVWATAVIGLAVGSGLYAVGLIATFIIVLSQIILHGKLSMLSPQITQMSLLVVDTAESREYVKHFLKEQGLVIMKYRIKRSEEESGLITMEFMLETSPKTDLGDLVNLMTNNHYIRSIELI